MREGGRKTAQTAAGCYTWLLFITVLVRAFSQTSALPFKAPCSVRRMEITFPHVIDVTNRRVQRPIPGRVEASGQQASLPEAFFLEFSWRREKIRLTLYINDIAPPTFHSEWEGDNETIAEVNTDMCFYHGYVKGHRSSYTAVSTCYGVAGYAQTDEEILFIEPASEKGSRGGPTPHVVYTCEDRERASDVHHWAPEAASTDGEMDAHWRRKRAARRNPKYLEVFMAVAPSVVKVVGKNKVKNYVMTLLNIVNSVYQHSSLDVDIRVALVRLDFIHDRTARRVTVSRNAYQTVRNFCEWAMYLHKPSDPQTHDIAVLLTREDIGPAGYAPITGLCNPIRSCAAIKDEGYTSAFIIAHEMAHVFGLFHDGHGNRCHGREYRTAIMATLVESKLNHYWWSKCSQERMKAVVDYLYCLNDDPYQLAGLPEVTTPLGRDWSLNEQCILEFGEQFSLCRAFYSDSCNMLWCGNYRNPHLCRTKRGPPLPGTPCGRDRQCQDGRCEYIGTNDPVHGHWGYWSAWTPCSSDCGIGLRYRTRKCDNPSPKYGGRACDGGKDEMGTCLNKRCETYNDIRAGECFVWEEMNVRPGRHTWKPYPAKNTEDQCKQTCISDSSREVVTLDIQTEDGSPCTYNDETNICIQGKCHEVGCDGVMNSTKKSDTCGVCGGDNSFCKTVTGEFLRKPEKKDEYEQILFLPHGARNVEITKTKRSPHFLALKDPERGNYYINGDGRAGSSKTLVADGALFNYARGQTYESLVSRGPLRKNMEIMLYPAGHLAPASVSYSYTVNKDDHTLERTKYKWKFTSWSDCSVTCGSGIQTILHGCFDKDEDSQVNKDMCSFLDLPRKDQARCHRESCNMIRYIWAMFNNYTDCSASCGDTGVKTQEYGCERNHPNETSQYVEHLYCEHNAAPNYTEPCNRVPCSSVYSHTWVLFDNYTECSSTCGDTGLKAQVVACERFFYDNGTVVYVDHSFCSGPRPEASVPCNRVACSRNYTLFIVTFDSECSVTCGDDGFMLIEYGCEKEYDDGTMEYVDNALCEGIPDGEERTPCNRVPCQGEQGHTWVVLDTYTECTETCGETGTRRKHYECQRSLPNGDTEYVEHRYCANVKAPDVEEECNRVPCDGDYGEYDYDYDYGDDGVYYEWSTLETYSDCSHTCGNEGIQKQNYVCTEVYDDGTFEEVEDFFCDKTPAPQESRPCNRVPCAEQFRFKWGMTDTYTECSQSCGENGEQTQNYVCEKHFINGDIETVEEWNCETIPVPDEVVPCNRFPCMPDVVYSWVALDLFTDCSHTCGTDGVQTQYVVCEKQNLEHDHLEDVDDDFCSDTDPPVVSQPCNVVPCVVESRLFWTPVDVYTECSVTCGDTGWQVQEHRCERHYIDGTIELAERQLCEDMELPDETFPCNRVPCEEDVLYKWFILNSFTECTEQCGDNGTMSPEYFCMKHSGIEPEEVDGDFCQEDPPPLPVPCNRHPCVVNVTWLSTGDGGECSEDCGEEGVQTVVYGCYSTGQDNDTTLVDSILCANVTMPNATSSCNRFPCDLNFRYNWTYFDAFTECSSTCGKEGIRFQHYGCERTYPNKTTQLVDDRHCKKRRYPEPDDPQPCNREPCIMKWTTGKWSQCSTTCGVGVQTREVFCGDPVHWNEDDVCDEDIPTPEKVCNRGPCFPELPPSCKKDKYEFCKHRSMKKCRFAGFRKMCCKSCHKGAGAAYRKWARRVRRKRRNRIKRRLRLRKRENSILKND